MAALVLQGALQGLQLLLQPVLQKVGVCVMGGGGVRVFPAAACVLRERERECVCIRKKRRRPSDQLTPFRHHHQPKKTPTAASPFPPPPPPVPSLLLPPPSISPPVRKEREEW